MITAAIMAAITVVIMAATAISARTLTRILAGLPQIAAMASRTRSDSDFERVFFITAAR